MRRILVSACAVSLLGACGVSPEPLEPSTLASIADGNLSRVVSDQEALGRPIDVYTAIAYALKYNLDQRVELMQQAVRTHELNLANYQGLPNLVAGSGYGGRSNYLASTSVSILTGQQSLVPSYSSERETIVGDLTLSWNVLDFGLSYVRARQAADQVLIQQENRRRALNRIVEDVRTAYWRAVASERLLSRLTSLEGDTKRALADSRALQADRQTSPVAALTYERELVEIRREAQRIEGELRVARSQLAALMNVPPTARFRLAGASAAIGSGHLNVEPRRLIRIALMNRPEIREVAYRQRINEKELDAALLELLPTLNPFVGVNADSNALLYNSNWVAWGARASWNLMKAVQYPAKRELLDAQGQSLDERSLALTMAIMTQVHVSRARFIHARKELDTAAQLRGIQAKLLRHVEESTTVDRTGEQALIREKMNMIVADVRYDLAYANVQNAYGNIYASLGLDAFPPVAIEQVSVAQLASALRKTWVGRGNLSVPAAPQGAQIASAAGGN